MLLVCEFYSRYIISQFSVGYYAILPTICGDLTQSIKYGFKTWPCTKNNKGSSQKQKYLKKSGTIDVKRNERKFM